MSSSRSQLEDVPEELMQLIQLCLPIEEAARTSVLSKSWLHAWSTLSTLRFRIRSKYSMDDTRRNMKLDDMDRTLKRYLHDNIPIERFDLDIEIYGQKSANLVDKCIRTMAINNNSTLKEVSLSYNAGCCKGFTDLPLEILSCENLTKLTVSNEGVTPYTRTHHPVIIKCVSLQELKLCNVNISQELLDGILSSCRLLVKIELIYSSKCLNTIKVNNLTCLHELKIVTGIQSSTALEINHVPNLGVFTWEQQNRLVPFNAHSISFGSSLKKLTLGNMVTYDNASLNMIKSGATLLESLTLDMANWELGSFHFTCASIKRLSLLRCQPKLIDITVYAPNLLFFRFDGIDMPSLLFPLSTLIKETTFRLQLFEPVNVSFFLRMRAALAISSNCNLYINTKDIRRVSLEIDIDDLRGRLPFPHAMNVQRLSLQTWFNKRILTRYPFIDALFEICHPNHVTAMRDHEYAKSNYFCMVMRMEFLVKKMTRPAYWLPAHWLCYLKHVQIRYNKKWETLTDSHNSFLDWPISDQGDFKPVDFKLEWR